MSPLTQDSLGVEMSIRALKEKLLVVIPLYNHAATVRQVVEQALAIHDQVLVVDDGSSDGGADVLTGLPVEVRRHPINRGKGAAILTAAAVAREQGMTHLATIDADGQHDPADLDRLLTVLAPEPFSVVVGKRDFTVDNVPGSSRFGRQFSNFWLRVQTGKSLGDTQSGFRIYPVELFERLRFGETRYSFEVEVLVKAAWAGVPLKDAQISVHYPPRDERVSHFRAFMDNLRLTHLNTKLTLRSFLPWPHQRLVRDEQEKISILRPLQSLRILLREETTPLQLAAAAVLGVILGAAPLIACHTIAILFVAGFFGLNKLLGVATSQLCMPPLVPALCIEVGYYMRHGEWLTEISWETLGHEGLERLWEWLLGSLVVGPLLGLVVGVAVYLLAGTLLRDRRAEV